MANESVHCFDMDDQRLVLPKVTAVVPIYGDPPYLSDLIASLKQQTVTPNIIATGTFVGENARRFLKESAIELVLREGSGGIASDWNFALDKATSPLCFIAHQDDMYAPEYVETLATLLVNNVDAVLAWADYDEINGTGNKLYSVLPLMKRILTELLSLGFLKAKRSADKKRLLVFGPVIACPVVMFNRTHLVDVRFNEAFRLNLDWDMWLRLAESETSGSFVRSRKKLLAYRRHPNAETSHGKLDGTRASEDYHMLLRLWPNPIAHAIAWLMKMIY